MKYVVYGVNRVSKDFLYIFEDLDIIYFIEDGSKQSEFLNYKVYDFDYAMKNKNYDKIIVCDFDKTNKKKKLDDYGLQYGVDYIFEEDFFSKLDENINLHNKKIAVWGTGQMAKVLLEHFSEVDVFIDSYKRDQVFNNRKVYKPDELDLKDYFVIVAVSKADEIYNYLENHKLRLDYDYCAFHKIVGTPSSMLRKTIFSPSYYDLECHTMLNHLEILNNGDTRCCCTTFVSQGMDNVLTFNISDIWKSNLHKIMCLSIENRTFSFCDKSMCPLFVNKNEQRISQNNLQLKNYRYMSEMPKVLALGYDPTCNLICRTCRKKVYVPNDRAKERIDIITEKIKSECLNDAEFLILAGDGEVFASPAYNKVYTDKECNPAYIRVLTNGTLFTPENWNKLIEGKNSKIMMTVSIDAATSDTYKKIRCGGNFEKLKKNMEFASQLRKRGVLSYLRFNFVVQRDNYEEMIAFTEWGEELGVDEIFFTKILNWGTYSEEEFKNVSMMEIDGITPKKELEAVLDNPVIKNSKIVDLGTIRYSHKIDHIDVVDDYYMWELEKRGGELFI